MTDLFKIHEFLSPRLAWLKKTEEDAVADLARVLNIPLWNEEGFRK